MTERFVFIAYLAFPEARLRDETLNNMKDLVDHVYEHEPETLKYAILTDEDGDDRGFWIFEEYTNQAAFAVHSDSKVVGSFKAQVFAVCDKERMRGLPLEYRPGCRADTVDLLDHNDASLVCAELNLNANSLEQATLDAIADKALMYGVLRNTQDNDRSIIVHVAKRDELDANNTVGKGINEVLSTLKGQGVCEKSTRLTKRHGFLYRKRDI